jgi:hypothetical protein
VRVFSGFAEEIQQWVLGEAGFSVLKKKITIVEDGSHFIAEDDTGSPGQGLYMSCILHPSYGFLLSPNASFSHASSRRL